MSAPLPPPRHFLVHAPPAAVELVQRAVDSAASREEVAATLAAAALPHQRVAAVSERVAGDVRKRPQARDNPRLAFAAGNLPYLIAATDPHGITEALASIRSLRSDTEAEAYFAAQAEVLGVGLRNPDRSMRAPAEEELAAFFRDRLERIAAGASPGGWRRLLTSRPDEAAVADGAAALGELLGRLGPVWAEGRGRWLGALVGELPDAAHDRRLLAGFEVDPVAARQAFGLPDRDSPVLEELRRCLAPAPFFGGGAAALIPAGNLEAIARLLTEGWPDLGPQAARFFLSDALDDWRRVLLAALHAAHAAGEPLLEAADVFRYGYRWPPI